MLKFSTIIFISAFFLSCDSNEGKKNDNTNSDTANKKEADTSSLDLGYYKIDGDSLIIPSFEIEVSLSPKANEKLKSKKETIIVAAYFSGQPKDTTTKEYLESGAMNVAISQKELTGDNRIAKIEGAKFSKALYDSLADKDIEVLINIYSGRRSFRDNLLNCDLLEEKMSKVKDQKFVLKGKLIVEH